MANITPLTLREISTNSTEVTAKSTFTGKTHTMVLPVSVERILAWQTGADRRVIQQCFPELDADQREFLMSGAGPGEWDETFKE